MKQFLRILTISLLFALPSIMLANNYIFTENKGQWPSQVEYRTDLNFGKIYFEPNRWLFDLGIYDHSLETEDCSDDLHHPHHMPANKFHAFAINFEGANSSPTYQVEGKSTDYKNYIIGNDPSKWASRAFTYQKLRYKNLYECTDLVIEESNDNLKYQFELKAGIDPSQIQMDFEGTNGLELANGDLKINLSTAPITDLAPKAWQIIDGNQHPIKVEYTLNSNKVGFHFPDGYNGEYPIVIDPELVFSSHTGSTAGNWGHTATYDADENSIGGGIVSGSGYPTVGAYDNSFNGGSWDFGITKFTADGSALMFSTYIGGSGDDRPHSMYVSTNGELVILGRTNSSNFPIQSGFDNSYNGGWDAVVLKLSEDGGTLLGSSFLGGSSVDGENSTMSINYGDEGRGEVVLDNNNDIYIATMTNSSNLGTAGAYQENKAGGVDAFVAKISSDVSTLIWASYLGGDGNDTGLGVKVNDSGEVYLTGGTRSNNFPTTPGVVYENKLGTSSNNAQSTDGFVARFSADGSTLLSATFIGTD